MKFRLRRRTKKRITYSVIGIVVAVISLILFVPASIYNELYWSIREYLKEPGVSVALFVGIGSIVVGFITYSFQNKQHKLNGLLEAFKLLNDEKHRLAREHVYTLGDKYEKEKDVGIFRSKGEKEYVEIVRADFDQLGMLVKRKSILKDSFLEAYGYNAFRCWECLEDHVLEQREIRQFPAYMRNFEYIAQESEIYWREVEEQDLKELILKSDDSKTTQS
jgi:hypothetical protein